MGGHVGGTSSLAWLPAALSAEGHALAARPLGGQSEDVWALEVSGRPIVLKRDRPRRGGGEADALWEHAFLARLTAAGFPAPRPVALFAGETCRRVGDRVWSALEYLPGRPLLWEPQPDIAAAGALLARYHHAARTIVVGAQRPSATPLDRLAALMPWGRLPAAAGSLVTAHRVADLLDDLERRLRAGGFGEMERLVIHGDCTTDNVIVDGRPPRVTGLIDFGSAYHEGWAADIAFGLWRSGRARPSDVALDLSRVGRFLHGYVRRVPIDPGAARLLPVLLWARGLQLAVRWVERPREEDLPALAPEIARILDRIEWIRAHEPDLTAAIAAALDEGRDSPTPRLN
jgi:Ser/Thr protein kinase RdoA (MazF antagonist)